MTEPGKLSLPSSMCEQPAGLLLMAVWFGLLAGLAEVLALAVKKFFLHYEFLEQPLQVVWMAPLANAVLYAIPGLILFLIARRRPRLVTVPVAALIFAFLGFFGLLLVLPLRVSEGAAALLAAGLAVQSARFVAAHSHGLHALVRRSTAWMVALVVGLGLGLQAWQTLAERRALATLPPASPNASNVLLIVLDTVRAQSLSLYGYARPTTPQLERLAGIGVRFDRAIATAPWTLPSHGSMFTGHFPGALSADWEIPLDSTYPTLAEVLRAHGYLTAGFVANTQFCPLETGLGRGFIRYEDYLISPGQIISGSSLLHWIAKNKTLQRIVNYHQILGRKSAAEVNSSFLRWLSRHERRPFFAFLNYFDAHKPYLPPTPFDTKFGTIKRREAFSRPPQPVVYPPNIQSELDAYEGSIAYLDHHVGLLLHELQRRGVLENTLVIITSDHGEEFNEHGIMGHSSTVYMPALRVPLLIIFPSRVPAGNTVSDLVSLRDLPATVMDLLHLKGGTQFPGSSLARFWDGIRDPGGRVSDPILSELKGLVSRGLVSKGVPANIKSLVVGRYHYIFTAWDMGQEEELYDFEQDPFELSDFAVRSEEGRRALDGFRSSLRAILAQR